MMDTHATTIHQGPLLLSAILCPFSPLKIGQNKLGDSIAPALGYLMLSLLILTLKHFFMERVTDQGQITRPMAPYTIEKISSGSMHVTSSVCILVIIGNGMSFRSPHKRTRLLGKFDVMSNMWSLWGCRCHSFSSCIC